MYGLNYLKSKLNQRHERVIERYKYYEMKKEMDDFSILDSPKLQNLKEVLGWCTKSVDCIADRVRFHGFSNDNFDMESIYDMNNRDILFDSAILGALISSCDFIYISNDETGFPRLQVIDGSNATGIIDPITYMLKEGYAVLERDEYKRPTLEAYFVPGATEFYQNGVLVSTIENVAKYPLLVPIIHRPDAIRPFGHSRISRACMNIQQSALRTLKRSEVSAEFYSFPQKYIVGLSEDAEFDPKGAAMSAMLGLTKDEDGQSPSVGQFTQQSMAPYADQLKMLASVFAGETGLTLDDLGFSTDNPTSEEAIIASHENLRLAAVKAQRSFATGFINAGYLASCIRDDIAYERSLVYRTKVQWEPIFQPNASMLGAIGDAIFKIEQAVPGAVSSDLLFDLTGIDTGKAPSDVQKLLSSNQDETLNEGGGENA